MIRLGAHISQTRSWGARAATKDGPSTPPASRVVEIIHSSSWESIRIASTAPGRWPTFKRRGSEAGQSRRFADRHDQRLPRGEQHHLRGGLPAGRRSGRSGARGLVWARQAGSWAISPALKCDATRIMIHQTKAVPRAAHMCARERTDASRGVEAAGRATGPGARRCRLSGSSAATAAPREPLELASLSLCAWAHVSQNLCSRNASFTA